MPQLPRARRYLCHAIRTRDAISALDWLTVDEGVQDGHGTVGYTGIGVDLLEDYG